MLSEGGVNGCPRVTIVTVVYNCCQHLEAAIDSVRKQTYPNIEYLVIDGGSTDGTLDLILSNQDIITDWVSEPDEGIYDAMNKGIALATGTYIGLLNADDLLLPYGVQKAVDALEALGQPGYTCGAVELIDEAGRKVGISVPFPEPQRLKRRFLEMPCPHLGVFVHRDLYEKWGVFDTSLRLRADYDLMLRFIAHDVSCVRIDEPLGKFRKGGVSGGMETWLETFVVHKKNGCPLGYSAYVFVRSIIKSNLASLIPYKFKRHVRKVLPSKNRYD